MAGSGFNFGPDMLASFGINSKLKKQNPAWSTPGRDIQSTEGKTLPAPTNAAMSNTQQGGSASAAKPPEPAVPPVSMDPVDQAPTPPPGILPGTPAYSAWLKSQPAKPVQQEPEGGPAVDGPPGTDPPQAGNYSVKFGNISREYDRAKVDAIMAGLPEGQKAALQQLINGGSSTGLMDLMRAGMDPKQLFELQKAAVGGRGKGGIGGWEGGPSKMGNRNYENYRPKWMDKRIARNEEARRAKEELVYRPMPITPIKKADDPEGRQSMPWDQPIFIHQGPWEIGGGPSPNPKQAPNEMPATYPNEMPPIGQNPGPFPPGFPPGPPSNMMFPPPWMGNPGGFSTMPYFDPRQSPYLGMMLHGGQVSGPPMQPQQWGG